MASGGFGRRTSWMRAKDSDRNDTCQILDAALAEGQLSMSEHGERVKKATSAATLGELQELVADLQTANEPAQIPTVVKLVNREVSSRRVGWGVRAAVCGVLVALGIAIGWGLYGNTSSPLDFTADPGAKSDGIEPVVLTAPKQLHSLGGVTGLIEQMRQRFGDTEGYRLVIYPDYASLDRADPGEDRRKLNYSYRGGFDDPTSSPRSDTDVLVDLARFDARQVIGVLRGAPETLGIKPADVKSTYLIVDPSGDPSAPGALELSVYVSSDYGSGYIEMAGDGTIKRINYPS